MVLQSFVLLLVLLLSACVPPYADTNSSIDTTVSKDLESSILVKDKDTNDNSNLPLPADAPQVRGHLAPVLLLQPTFQGDRADALFSVSDNGTLLRWDLRSGKAYRLFAGEEKHLRAVALSRSGRLLAIGNKDGIKVIDVPTGETLYHMDRVRSRVHSLAFFPDEESLLIGAVDGRVYRWLIHQTVVDSEVGDQRNRAYQRYIGHATVVSSVAVHPEGRVFFSGDWAGMLFAWLPYDADVYEGEYDKNIFDGEFYSDLAIRQQVKSPPVSNSTGVRLDALRASPDGNFVVTARESGDIELWKVRGFKLLTSTRAHKGLIRALDVSPNGKLVLTYGRDDTVKVWDVLSEHDEFLDQQKAELELRYEFKIPDSQKVVFVRNDRILAGTDEGTILEVDLSKLQKVVPKEPKKK